MLNIEAKKLSFNYVFSAEGQTLQTTFSSYENVFGECIFVNRVPGLQVDLLTRARARHARAPARGEKTGAKQTKGQRDKGKKRQRDEGKTRQRDDGTKGQQTRRRRDEGTKDDGTTNVTGNRQKLDGTEELSLITTIW